MRKNAVQTINEGYHHRELGADRRAVIDLINYVNEYVDEKINSNKTAKELINNISQLRKEQHWNKEDEWLLQSEEYLEEGTEYFFDQLKYESYCNFINAYESGKYKGDDVEKLKAEEMALKAKIASNTGIKKILNAKKIGELKRQLESKQEEIKEREQYIKAALALRKRELAAQPYEEKIQEAQAQLDKVSKKIIDRAVRELFEKEPQMNEWDFKGYSGLNSMTVEAIKNEQSKRDAIVDKQVQAKLDKEDSMQK